MDVRDVKAADADAAEAVEAAPFSHELPALPDGTRLDIATLPPAASCDDVCLGGRVWVAAPALCGWLSSVADELFVGRSVLEVGAGTGACGLYAAALGAARVVLTDGGDDAVPRLLGLLEDNVKRNRARLPPAAVVEVAPLHWGCEDGLLPAGPFDWVIGSDVTWGSDHESHAALCLTLSALLLRGAPATRVALAMEHGLPVPAPDHPGTYRDETVEQFQAQAAAHALRVEPLAPLAATGDDEAFLDLRWPAHAFSAFTARTTSGVFVVEVRLA